MSSDDERRVMIAHVYLKRDAIQTQINRQPGLPPTIPPTFAPGEQPTINTPNRTLPNTTQANSGKFL